MAQQSRRTAKSHAPFPSEADLHTWAAELDAVAAKLARRFERTEPRQRVLAYLAGCSATPSAKTAGSWQGWLEKRRRMGCSDS